jgi:hypothetical protein
MRSYKVLQNLLKPNINIIWDLKTSLQFIFLYTYRRPYFHVRHSEYAYSLCCFLVSIFFPDCNVIKCSINRYNNVMPSVFVLKFVHSSDKVANKPTQHTLFILWAIKCTSIATSRPCGCTCMYPADRKPKNEMWLGERQAVVAQTHNSLVHVYKWKHRTLFSVYRPRDKFYDIICIDNLLFAVLV